MSGEHIIQLFDAPRSCADTAARFLAAGWNAGDPLLVIAKPHRWNLIAVYLERLGVPVHESTHQKRLRVFDAGVLLRRVRRRGVLVPNAAAQVMSELVEASADIPQRLRIYGELVELLAEEGNFDGACQIEDAWNEVIGSRSVDMLCGYSAAHFADPQYGSALRRICARHSRVQTHSADSLGSWLVCTTSLVDPS